MQAPTTYLDGQPIPAVSPNDLKLMMRHPNSFIGEGAVERLCPNAPDATALLFRAGLVKAIVAAGCLDGQQVTRVCAVTADMPLTRGQKSLDEAPAEVTSLLQ